MLLTNTHAKNDEEKKFFYIQLQNKIRTLKHEKSEKTKAEPKKKYKSFKQIELQTNQN